jgi:hypothetical protein
MGQSPGLKPGICYVRESAKFPQIPFSAYTS